MTSLARSAAAWAALLLGAACGNGTQRIPKAPPSTLTVVADEDEPREGWPGEREQGGGEEGSAAETAEPQLRRGPCGIPVAVSLEGLMQPGAVERIQERLVGRALLSSPYRAGELDRPTLEAILELQRRSGLPVVGLPGYATARALGIDPTEVFVSGSARCGGAS